MRIRRLSVRHLGAVERCALELGPGLNVLHGPNDLGKSTLAAAIRMALLLPSTSKAAEPYAPWGGGGPPAVELVLELGPQRFLRVAKEYAGNRGTAVLESSRDGRSFVEEHRGRAVDGELRRMLGWGIAEPGGQGGQKGVPESFLATVLLGLQDDVDGILARGLDDDDVASGRDRVAAALQALARDARFVAILGAAQARYDEAWTASGQVRRGAGGRLKEVAEDVTRSRAARDGYRKLVEETAHVQAELAELTRRREVAAETLRVARERRAASERQALDAQVADARRAVERLEAAERAAGQERERCRGERDRAAAALREATSATDAADEAAERAAVQQRELELAQAERRLAEATGQARAAQALAAAVRGEGDARRRREEADRVLGARDAELARADAALERWRGHEGVLVAEEELAAIDLVVAQAEALREAVRAAEGQRDALAAARRAASERAEGAAEAGRRAEAELAASRGDEARQRCVVEVAEAERAHADAERRAAAAAARRAAEEALQRAEEAWAVAAREAVDASTAAEAGHGRLAEWDEVEPTLALWDARADLVRSDARASALAEADARLAELVRRRDGAAADRGALVVPIRAELAAIRGVVAQLEGARSALSVGIAVRVEPRGPIAVSVRADGAEPQASTGPIDVEARGTVVVDLGDVATVTVTGGGRAAREKVEALERRHAQIVAPALADAGAEDLAALEAAVERAEDLDRARVALDVEIEAATRARDALPAPDPDAAARVERLSRALGERRVAALDALGDDPRSAWTAGRAQRTSDLQRAVDAATAKNTTLALATAERTHALRTLAERVAPDPDPAELARARARRDAANGALAALDRDAEARVAELTARVAAAAAELDRERATAAGAEGEHAAAIAACGAAAGRLAETEGRLAGTDRDAVVARLAALRPDLDPAFVDLGADRRRGWKRTLAARTRARDEAAERRSTASTDAAVQAQRHERAQADLAAASLPDLPDLAAALAAAAGAEAAVEGARRASAEARAAAATRSAGRAEAQAAAVAALDAAERASVAADGAVRDATVALGQECHRLAELVRSRDAAGGAGAQRHPDEALPRLDPAALAAARDRETELEAAAEEAERAVQRQQGKLEHVGGAVAEERLAEADAAHELALQRERELHTDYEGWRLLREVLLDAERDQAANLGGALGPLVSARLKELTGARYADVVLAPHLTTEGVVVHGKTRAAGSLSVGTREQLSTLVRLCLAERLETMLVLDDQLVQSDDLKLGWFRRALVELATKVQVVVFTCRPGDYPGPGDGTTVTDLDRCVTRHPG